MSEPRRPEDDEASPDAGSQPAPTSARVPEDSERPHDPPDYPAAALALAGCVLAPERRSPSQLKIGQLLLRESLMAAARASSKERPISSLSEALGEFEQSGAMKCVRGGDERGRAILDALIRQGPPDAETLEDAEVVISELLDPPLPGAQRRGRRFRWVLGVLLAVTVAVVLLANRESSPRWEDYRWKTSSAAHGFPGTGTLRDRGGYGLIFHTDNEKNPWVVVDMLAPRSIKHIVIKSREDCCYERGLPMVVEVGLDGKSFAPVGRQHAVFDTWEVDFSAREARYIRIRSEAHTTLHLREIRVP